MPIGVDIAESQLEHDLVVSGTGAFADGLRNRGIAVAPRARSPIELLASLGVLDARPLLIHCVRVDAADIALIARNRCAVAHCPASNAKLGHGVAPLAELLAAKITVGIGSDSMASNNRMDLLAEARLASLLQRGRRRDFNELTANTMLMLATLGGARVIGIENEVGSLEAGKAADLAAFPLDSVGPIHDPVASALFALPGARASFVAVAGKELVRNGDLLAKDASLEQRVQQSANALQTWLRST
jgi:cytosine/adenosine deaminase-related metal-dependent hydrolase